MAIKKKVLSDSEISAFCEQLAFMIKAGITLQEGLMLLSADVKNAKGQDITDRLLGFVEEGSSLAEALRRSGEFPSYMISMIEIGETSGRLEDVLESLRVYYERNEAISKSIKSAVTYPLVMIVMMLVVVLIIIVQVLPVFQGVFEQLGSELSGFVQGILGFGEWVSANVMPILVVVVAIVAVFLTLRNTKRGNAVLSGISSKLFRGVNSSLASGRFASAMALMLGSGMDVDQALDMTKQLLEDKRTQQKVDQIKEDMENGKGFADAIVDSGMFTGLYGKMITVGFKTGTLDEVMDRIAHHYEEETNRRISASVAAIEPTLVAILSVVVGAILLAVMLPLMGIMSAIG
jgi:type IV pilus assembly protein PilC